MAQQQTPLAQGQTNAPVAPPPPSKTEQDAARKGLRGRQAQSNNAVREELARQPKMRVFIPRPSHIKKGMHFNEVVRINDYPYTIPAGVWCSVPEEVYLILVRSGKIAPQREEDEFEVPAIVTMNDGSYDLMDQGRAGSVANPVEVH